MDRLRSSGSPHHAAHQTCAETTTTVVVGRGCPRGRSRRRIATTRWVERIRRKKPGSTTVNLSSRRHRITVFVDSPRDPPKGGGLSFDRQVVQTLRSLTKAFGLPLSSLRIDHSATNARRTRSFVRRRRRRRSVVLERRHPSRGEWGQKRRGENLCTTKRHAKSMNRFVDETIESNRDRFT